MALPAISARSARRALDLAAVAAQRVDARIEGRVRALGGVGGQRAGDERRRGTALPASNSAASA